MLLCCVPEQDEFEMHPALSFLATAIRPVSESHSRSGEEQTGGGTNHVIFFADWLAQFMSSEKYDAPSKKTLYLYYNFIQIDK